MANLKGYTIAWTLPTDPNVVSVRVRCSQIPFKGDASDYAIPFDDVGLVSQATLPLPHTPLINGTLFIGVSTVDNIRNEFFAPSPVTNLHII